jgi:hypothetical protein
MTDEAYSNSAGRARAALTAAGDDLCALSEAMNSVPPPSNPGQVKDMMAVFEVTYERAASAIEDQDAVSAASLRDAMAELTEAAEEADYAVDFLSGESPPAALSSPEFMAASQALQARYNEECLTPGAAAGGPGGAP